MLIRLLPTSSRAIIGLTFRSHQQTSHFNASCLGRSICLRMPRFKAVENVLRQQPKIRLSCLRSVRSIQTYSQHDRVSEKIEKVSKSVFLNLQGGALGPKSDSRRIVSSLGSGDRGSGLVYRSGRVNLTNADLLARAQRRVRRDDLWVMKVFYLCL